MGYNYRTVNAERRLIRGVKPSYARPRASSISFALNREALSKLLKREGSAGAEGAILPYVGFKSLLNATGNHETMLHNIDYALHINDLEHIIKVICLKITAT